VLACYHALFVAVITFIVMVNMWLFVYRKFIHLLSFFYFLDMICEFSMANYVTK